MEKWARIKYQPNLPLYEGERVTASTRHILLSKEAAEEGLVLLKNEEKLLPLKKGQKVALVGKAVYDYVKGGGGSGDVSTPYVVNLAEGIEKVGCQEMVKPLADYYRDYVADQYAAGAPAGMMEEAPVPTELLQAAAEETDIAIFVISRFSGEGWDRSDYEFEGEYNPWPDEGSMPKRSKSIFPKGDFYLAPGESALLAETKKHFDRIIVLLNIGGIIETGWIRDDAQIKSAILMGQGGMEGGTAVAEALAGKINPSGHLTDTYAGDLTDYPSTEGFFESPHYAEYTEDIYVGYRYFNTIPGAETKIIYPFGHGLSYTSFDREVIGLACNEETCALTVRVKNTGSLAGKDAVLVFADLPQGKLDKPKRVLLGFAKTSFLLAGESGNVTVSFSLRDLSSFDEAGVIQKSAFVLEKGDYVLLVGHSTLDCVEAGERITVTEDRILEQLHSYCAPTSLTRRLHADGTYEALPAGAPHDLNECIFEKMEPGTEEAIVPEQAYRAPYMMMDDWSTDRIRLQDVAEGKASLDDLLSQMTDQELIALLGGQPNTGVANTWGLGNQPKYGIPSAMTADGPAGVRLNAATGVKTTAWPCATTLACSFNTDLVERVGRAGGEELKENNLGVWLTPAVNIHRSPYCGRNFEYYSEDPVVAGKMGAALVRGIQANRVGASVKHFAANNKETNRKHSDSRLSERALREIYLRNFEIIVKEARPWTIMSSYNAINGHRASENRELLTGILREEWGYEGIVTSDWWTRGEHYKEILAGNDLKMACGFPERVARAQEAGIINRADYLPCAKRILELLLKFD